MQDVLGYAGTRVVVTGAASGMGEAAARLLVELGAEVHALDVRPVKVGVAQALLAGDVAALNEAAKKLSLAFVIVDGKP